MTDRELLQAIYNDTQELKQKVSNIESDVTDIKLTLELLRLCTFFKRSMTLCNSNWFIGHAPF